jgi:hypothetical protein
MEIFDAVQELQDDRAPAAQNAVSHGDRREHASQAHDALDSELFGAGVRVLSRRFAAARLTTWPDGSRTVLRTVAEQREAATVLSDGQGVVPVTADGYLLPSV